MFSFNSFRFLTSLVLIGDGTYHLSLKGLGGSSWYGLYFMPRDARNAIVTGHPFGFLIGDDAIIYLSFIPPQVELFQFNSRCDFP